MIREIHLWDDFPAQFDTIYFGGGTPSALRPDQLAAILEAVRKRVAGESDPFVSLEANPEDVHRETLADWRSLGVRTLSLGVQSFQPEALRFLGRRHSPEEGRRAVEESMAAGFATVSVDLIFGLPDQTEKSLKRDLAVLEELRPQHVSCYQLTIHEGTPFGFRAARGQLEEMGNDAQADLFALTHRSLADQGLEAYEVSNFARAPRHRSRHNQKYWRHVPYLGLGPSAHSFFGHRRWWNHRKIKPWLRAVEAGERPIAGAEELSRLDLALETVMLGMRTTEGLDLAAVKRRFQVDLLERNEKRFAELEAEGLIRRDGTRIRPTVAGLAVAEGLVAYLELGEE